MVKIRLRRMGSKNSPSYRIVIADSRASQAGAYIEKIGHYNPISNPETIVIDEEKAIKWLKNGAQPSDAVARMLSTLGIMEKFKAGKGITAE